MRFALNCSLVLAHLPVLERPAAAAAAGFDAVEFWRPFVSSHPSDGEVDAFVTAVQQAGVQLVGLNFAAGDMSAGDRGLVSWPGREEEFREAVDCAVALARRLELGESGGVFNALYGNRLDGAPGQCDVAAGNLTYAAEAAAGIGATVVLEPLSGVDRYPLRTMTDAVAALDRVGAPNLGILADLYHLTVNGDDAVDALRRHAQHINHVQLADVPGRGRPGTGSFDFAEALATLADIGYDRFVALEYLPLPTEPLSFDWFNEWRSAL